MGQATSDLQGFQSVAQRTGADTRQAMTTVGLAAAGAGLAISAALGASAKAAIDWQSAFAGVVKTVDATDAELAVLEQGLRDLAQEIPVTHAELAGIAEAAGQLGIETDNILSFTATMAALGAATNLTSEEAATMFARFANITGLPQDRIENLGSAVVDLGNNLATTEREITEMGLRIAGAGSQIGLTEAEIVGFAGALSSVGIEAQAGGTAISRVFVEVDKNVRSGGQNLETFARVAGMTADQFRQAYEVDASGAIVTFIEGLGGISAAGGDVFGVLEDLGLQDIRVRDALLRAAGAGDLFRRSLERSSDAFDDNTALSKEAEQRYATVASKIQIAKNSLYELGITVGEILLPVLIPMIDGVKNVAQWFSDLPQPVKAVGVALAGVSGILLTVAGTALILGPRIIALVNAWKTLRATILATQAAGAAGNALGGLGGVAGSATFGSVGNARGALNALPTAAKAGIVVGAAVAVEQAVEAAVDLKNQIDDGQATLAQQLAGIMQAAADGDQEAAQRLTDLREQFKVGQEVGWLDSINPWSDQWENNQFNEVWTQAEQVLADTTAAGEDLGDTMGGVSGAADTTVGSMTDAASAVETYRDVVQQTTEAQLSLVSAMNVAFGETGSAIQAVQAMQAAEENLNAVLDDTEASAQDVAAAQYDYAASIFAAQEAVDSMSTAALQATIDGLAQALGLSKDQAADLLVQLGLLDGKTVKSFIEVETSYTGGGRDFSPTTGGNRARGGGGPVMAGVGYRVGEGNRPELLTTPSGLFLVPGDAGRMFSHQQSKDLIAAMSRQNGQGQTINLTQYWPQGERVENGTRRGLATAGFLRAAS
jgi:TP901 family phage tail tape measure protein